MRATIARIVLVRGTIAEIVRAAHATGGPFGFVARAMRATIARLVRGTIAEIVRAAHATGGPFGFVARSARYEFGCAFLGEAPFRSTGLCQYHLAS